MAQSNLNNRFIDAGKEPTKTLTPIKGYEKKDLVSLEEAVAEIQPEAGHHDAIWRQLPHPKNFKYNFYSFIY